MPLLPPRKIMRMCLKICSDIREEVWKEFCENRTEIIIISTEEMGKKVGTNLIVSSNCKQEHISINGILPPFTDRQDILFTDCNYPKLRLLVNHRNAFCYHQPCSSCVTFYFSP